MRDRIKELRRVKASTLVPCPLNWRKHPKRQRDLLTETLKTIGYADALIARETENGELVLIDGHLRADLSPEQEVPVLIVDLDEKEANELLLLLDPLAELAQRNDSAVEKLLENIATENETIQNFLDENFRFAAQTEIETSASSDREKFVAIPDLYQVVVECENEDDQRVCFEELVAQGRKCRLLNL